MLTSAVIIVLCCSIACIQAWPCDSSPCKNGGTCNSLVFTYSCTCPITATGANCQTLLTDDVKCLGNTNTLYQGYDGTKVKFHPFFTPDLYQVSLRFISLGYVVAAQYRYGSTADSEAFRVKLAQNLADADFAPYTTFYGKTGASSTTPDASGLITYRTSDNIILVTCHGSLAANLAAEIIDPQSDWGTDFNYNVVTASAAGLTDIAGDVQMHAGVARNYKSFQAALNQQISTILNTKLTSHSPVWIYVTGHSLGGGMSVLVGPGIRAYLNNNQRTDVNVGVVALSGLTIFSGQTAQTWIGNSIGHCNIIRLDVKGDPVPILPPLTQYKHVGVHFLDDIDNVHSKQIALYGSPLDNGFAVAAYHYGQVTRFDYDIVMKHSEFTYRRQYALNNDYGTRYAMNTPV